MLSPNPTLTRLLTTRLRPWSLSHHGAIVLALASLGSAPVSVEDLVMAAWRRFPERFGLRGYDHPNANAVIAKLSGDGNPVARGYIARRGPGVVQLTRAGAEHARLLTARLALGAT